MGEYGPVYLHQPVAQLVPMIRLSGTFPASFAHPLAQAVVQVKTFKTIFFAALACHSLIDQFTTFF